MALLTRIAKDKTEEEMNAFILELAREKILSKEAIAAYMSNKVSLRDVYDNIDKPL